MAGRFFENFKPSAIRENVIWQEHESIFPYQCSQCRRTFEKGGKRYLGSSLTRQGHNSAVTLCPDCKEGKDVFKRKQPKLAERRKSLD